MTLTKSFTKLGVATATLAAVGGFMAVSAEIATAATFKVQADIIFEEDGSPSFDVGDIFGSFDYDVDTNFFSNINLTSVFVGTADFPSFTTTYNTLVNGSIDTLVAKASGSTRTGITLLFPNLNTIPVGSTVALRAGSLTLASQRFSLSTPLEGTVTAVPTPALLPGLIGLGVAALRRKDEEPAEENA